MTDQNNAAQAAPQQAVLTREQIGELYKDWVCVFGVNTGSAELCIREIEAAVLSALRAPVADERDIWLVCLSREYYNGGDRPLLAVPTEAMAQQIAADLQQYCRDLHERLDANNWYNEADPEISNKLYEESEALFAAAQFPHGVKLDRYDLDNDFSFWPLSLSGAPAALASAPVAGEAQPASITSRRLSGVLSMDGASLHMKPDGSGQIIVAEEDFTLEDDRSEGPDGPQGGVHWVACLAASEMDALLVYLNGHARPSDDALWDQTLTERDEYHDMADKLANAIADHLLVEIGEHSSSNCPWMRALEAIENAAPQAMPDDVRRQVIAECRRVIGSTDGRKEPAAQALAHWVSAKLRAAPRASATITHYECGPYNGDGTYEAVPVYAAPPLASTGDARRALGGYQTDSFRVLKTHPAPAAAKDGQQRARDVSPLLARALDEWHEDDGPVMWWAWCGHEWAGEAPWCGTPHYQDWPGYHTHWTPIAGFPATPSPQSAAIRNSLIADPSGGLPTQHTDGGTVYE
ncbi:hypothetical protein AVE30378_02192 [Achromobacter veterisilvae]|uniref:Uncharacterized protein n=1 Tax=Achromobacter veterisilvae TaxID=2069367 RepID=A0A446CFS0_9BURK|nr:hypothetical protein [Achromobacter veterisilvae]SSW66653.1 hypothetical protein AVE30378_02192 [Achromobacter veterisilvae]